MCFYTFRTNVVMNYSDTEAKVREATSDDPWGPSGSLMQEIARASYAYNTFPDVMGMLWCRIFHEGNKNWRRIYKVILYFLSRSFQKFNYNNFCL